MTEPKYAELANKLRSDISEGVYTEGQRLPSENELAAQTGYSRQTVRQAMEVLAREGLTDRVRGSGTYVKRPLLSRERTYNIAVVTTYIGEYIFPDILRGIDHVLAKNGYASLLTATRNRVDNERRMLFELLDKPIDGMLAEGTKTALPNPNIDLYERFEQKGIPIVFFNSYYPALKNPVYVVSDDREGGRAITQALLDQGHRGIAGIFKSDDIQGHRRYAGYTDALIQAGLPVKDDQVLWCVTENMAALIASHVKSILSGCTGLVCYNDEVAIQVIRTLGEDVRRLELVSLDGSTYAQLSATPFFSLPHPKEQLGRLAAEKLLNILNGKKESSVELPWLS